MARIIEVEKNALEAFSFWKNSFILPKRALFPFIGLFWGESWFEFIALHFSSEVSFEPTHFHWNDLNGFVGTRRNKKETQPKQNVLKPERCK